jgi:hypothetical protein
MCELTQGGRADRGDRELGRTPEGREPVSAQPVALGGRQCRSSAAHRGGVGGGVRTLELDTRPLVAAQARGTGAAAGSHGSNTPSRRTRHGQLCEGLVAALRGGERTRLQQAPGEASLGLRHGVERDQRPHRHFDLQQGGRARHQVLRREKHSPVPLRADGQSTGDVEARGGERRADQETPGSFALDSLVRDRPPIVQASAELLTPLVEKPRDSGDVRQRVRHLVFLNACSASLSRPALRRGEAGESAAAWRGGRAGRGGARRTAFMRTNSRRS